MATTTTSSEYQISLPTLTKLGVTAPPLKDNIDVSKVLSTWSEPFFKALSSNNVNDAVSQIVEEGLWRDMLALTWNFQTLFKHEAIRKMLDARLGKSKVSNVRLSDHKDKQPALFYPSPGLVWIQGFFDFETAVGICSGVVRIVPTQNGVWKAHTVYTNLEELKGFTPKAGQYRSYESNYSFWVESRPSLLS